MPPPTLYIIDGYAQFFRAYHAIRSPMTSPVTKEPTNMTYGFVGMLLKLLRAEGKIGAEGGRPDYLAVAIDVSGDRETFRSTLYPEYKATRSPPPEDLFVQVERCLAILKDLGVPILGAAGFEADDVIATLVTRLRQERPDLRIRFISKDKDLKQLLSSAGNGESKGGVEMYDIHTDELIDVARLKEDTGLTPAQVIDMLALMGDNVDNVPGVEGVGPKTAAQLIAQYGSLDNLLAHADEIKGKRGEALRAAADKLDLSRRLVTLRHDTPFDFALEDARTTNLKLERLLPVLRELGFNRYQDEVRALQGGAALPSQAPGPGPGAGRAPPSVQRSRSVEPPPLGGLFEAIDVPAPSSAPTSIAGAEYKCIRTRGELDALLQELRSAEVIAIDTETTGLSPLRAHIVGISLSTKPRSGYYIPVRSPRPGEHLDQGTVLEALRPILEDPAVPKTGHNLKYDLLIFRKHNIALRGLANGADPGTQPSAPGTPLPADLGSRHSALGTSLLLSFDSMVSSFLIDASRSSHSLDALALALLHRHNISIAELIGSGKNQRGFDTVPLDQATCYAAEDADVALQLRSIMLPQLRAMHLMDLFSKVELPLVEVLAELEWNGILVDPVELEHQRKRLQGRIDDLRKQIDRAAKDALGRTFNPDSPRQLAAVLFNKPDDEVPGLGIRSLKRIATGHSTDIEVLEKLAADPAITSPIPALIVEHRQLTKLVGTYLVALAQEINPETKRIHSSFNQTVAVTGRLASSDPNLQNIPIRTDVGREIRKAFIAPPGHVLISADYSQIELRLLAHLSRDPALIQAFHEGQDIHTAVAAQIHAVTPEDVTREQRNGAKMVNFGIVYGITAFGLARRLGISTTAAEEIIRGYKKRFSGITTFLQECISQAMRNGYVETMLKRRRPIPDIESRNPSRRAMAERTAINSVVQGSAADLIKLAMVDLHQRLAGPAPDAALRGTRMLLQIHDELVFESPRQTAEAARRVIVDRMQNAMDLSVPLKVDASIATNWFDGK